MVIVTCHVKEPEPGKRPRKGLKLFRMHSNMIDTNVRRIARAVGNKRRLRRHQIGDKSKFRTLDRIVAAICMGILGISLALPFLSRLRVDDVIDEQTADELKSYLPWLILLLLPVLRRQFKPKAEPKPTASTSGSKPYKWFLLALLVAAGTVVVGGLALLMMDSKKKDEKEVIIEPEPTTDFKMLASAIFSLFFGLVSYRWYDVGRKSKPVVEPIKVKPKITSKRGIIPAVLGLSVLALIGFRGLKTKATPTNNSNQLRTLKSIATLVAATMTGFNLWIYRKAANGTLCRECREVKKGMEQVKYFETGCLLSRTRS